MLDQTRPARPARLARPSDSSVDRPAGTARQELRRVVARAAPIALVLVSWSASLAIAAPGPAPSPKISHSSSATSSPSRRAGATATATPLAGGAPRPAQALSIAVDDGKASATKGDRLGYTVTVQNTGTATARSLQISQSMPAGLRFGSADHRGVATAGADPQVRWTVDIKPGASAVLHTTATVQVTPKALLRLASVACAGAKTAPIVCAADSDQLPAGAGAAAAAATSSSAAEGPLQRQWMWFASSAVLLGLLVLSVLLRRRWARARRGATSDGSPTSPIAVSNVELATGTYDHAEAAHSRSPR